jgi:hypothetical protein
LEIELDAVYRSMLLLKKKKYAAVKVRKQDANQAQHSRHAVPDAGLPMPAHGWAHAHATAALERGIAG